MAKENGERSLSRLDELRAKHGGSAPPEIHAAHVSPPQLADHDYDEPRNTFFFYRGIRRDGTSVRFPRLLRVIPIPSAVLLLIGSILLGISSPGVAGTTASAWGVVGALLLLTGVAIPVLAFAGLLVWITFGYLDTPYDKQTKIERLLNEPVYWAER